MYNALEEPGELLDGFRQIERAERMNLFEFYPQGNGYSSLEGIKNQIIGWEHLPHPDFLDKGILSATMLAHKSSEGGSPISLNNVVRSFMHTLRIYD